MLESVRESSQDRKVLIELIGVSTQDCRSACAGLTGSSLAQDDMSVSGIHVAFPHARG
jgi:hypothetical protein